MIVVSKDSLQCDWRRTSDSEKTLVRLGGALKMEPGSLFGPVRNRGLQIDCSRPACAAGLRYAQCGAAVCAGLRRDNIRAGRDTAARQLRNLAHAQRLCSPKSPQSLCGSD
jgi:hypothetical protein